MEREKLTKLARELNDLLGIAPPINADDPDDLLGAACQEAAGLLEKGDTLSDTAVEALKELGCSDALKKIGIKVMKTSKEKKEKKEKGPGVISSIVSILGSGPQSAEEILSKLLTIFPGRAPESMSSTIKMMPTWSKRMDRGFTIQFDKESKKYNIPTKE